MALDLKNLSNGQKAAVGAGVVLVGYLGYRWYKNRQAASSGAGTLAQPATAADTTGGIAPAAYGAPGGGFGGGGGGFGGGPTPLADAINALTTQLQSGATTSSPTSIATTTGSTATNAVTASSTDNTTSAATGTQPVAVGTPSSTPYTGLNVTPGQAQALVQQNILTPRAALASETPASQLTPAQRHAQEVANRPLRKALRK